MEEMSRCIHCTRCVRFGQEIAGGVMELGMDPAASTRDPDQSSGAPSIPNRPAT